MCFDDFVEELGYDKTERLNIYWLLPWKELADGLWVIINYSNTSVMVSVVDRVKNLVVYFDHDDNIVGLDFDDILVNPVARLPKILSPHKVEYVPNKVNEKLPQFYSGIQSTSKGRMNEKPPNFTVIYRAPAEAEWMMKALRVVMMAALKI